MWVQRMFKIYSKYVSDNKMKWFLKKKMKFMYPPVSYINAFSNQFDNIKKY